MPYIIKNGIAYAGNAVTVTQAQYDALSEAEKKNGTVYYIYDSDALLDASDVSYDNTSSGLSATNTQAAIDSLNNGLENYKDLVGRRSSITLPRNSTLPLTVNLKNYLNGIVYAYFPGNSRWYSSAFDVQSLGTTHQLYVNGDAYMDYSANLTANTFSTNSVTGFTNLVLVLYR